MSGTMEPRLGSMLDTIGRGLPPWPQETNAIGATATPPSDLATVLCDLECTLSSLDSDLATLRDELHPFLVPQPPSVCKNSTKPYPEAASPLVERLRTFAAAAVAIRARVNELSAALTR